MLTDVRSVVSSRRRKQLQARLLQDVMARPMKVMGNRVLAHLASPPEARMRRAGRMHRPWIVRSRTACRGEILMLSLTLIWSERRTVAISRARRELQGLQL